MSLGVSGADNGHAYAMPPRLSDVILRRLRRLLETRQTRQHWSLKMKRCIAQNPPPTNFGVDSISWQRHMRKASGHLELPTRMPTGMASWVSGKIGGTEPEWRNMPTRTCRIFLNCLRGLHTQSRPDKDTSPQYQTNTWQNTLLQWFSPTVKELPLPMRVA